MPDLVIIVPTAPDMGAWYAAMWDMFWQCRGVLALVAGGTIAVTLGDVVLDFLRRMWA